LVHEIAGGLADLIHSVHNDIVIRSFRGGRSNPALLNKKDAIWVGGLPFMNFAAFNGEDPFESKLEDLRALVGGMSMNLFPLLVGADHTLPRTLMRSSGRKRRSVSPYRLQAP